MIWPRRVDSYDELPELRLEGFRVYLRPPKRSDMDDWISVRSKNREFLEPFEPTWPQNCLTSEFFNKRLKRMTSDWQSDRAYSFFIFLNESDVFIGGVNINNVARGASQSATLGYWLSKDQQRSGYMSEALRQIIIYAFEELKLHRLNAGCLLDNQPSISLLKKLGFEEEGMAKKFVQINGKWQDHKLFGLPVEHWKDKA